MMTPRVKLRSLGLAAGLAVALAGCSSTDDNSFQKLGALAKISVMGAGDPVAQPEPTRAQLDEIPSATIALSMGDGPRTFLVPLADNGGYLNYLDAGGVGLVMLGGAVTGTQSLGQDLEAVRQQQDDPVARPTPVAAWPDRVTRDYQFAQRDGVDYNITLSCVFEPLANETIEIVEIEFDVVRISEICTNAMRQIVNTYWVEAETGFIWKSQQWLGPFLEQATIEIIRPYGG
jgi:group 4 capsule polysaccharide lipoprotein GfcB/YjbF